MGTEVGEEERKGRTLTRTRRPGRACVGDVSRKEVEEGRGDPRYTVGVKTVPGGSRGVETEELDQKFQNKTLKRTTIVVHEVRTEGPRGTRGAPFPVGEQDVEEGCGRGPRLFEEPHSRRVGTRPQL